MTNATHPKSFIHSASFIHATSFIHESSIIDERVQVGEGSKIWHFCHILPDSTIGAHCIIAQNCAIGPSVHIGNGCKIQNNVSIYKGVRLEDGVFVGPSAVFTNVINPRAFIERKDEFRPTLLRRGCSIGANATILCGVEIGAYAMVGAGSVVLRDVAPFALVVGNPARLIGYVDKAGVRLAFDERGRAKSSYDNSEYILENGIVRVLEPTQAESKTPEPQSARETASARESTLPNPTSPEPTTKGAK